LSQLAYAWVLSDRSPGDAQARAMSERRLAAALAMSGGLLAIPFAFRPLMRLLGIAVPTAGDVALSGGLAAGSFAIAQARRIQRTNIRKGRAIARVAA
jgi:Ca2+-transporting ATPase